MGKRVGGVPKTTERKTFRIETNGPPLPKKTHSSVPAVVHREKKTRTLNNEERDTHNTHAEIERDREGIDPSSNKRRREINLTHSKYISALKT